MSRIFLSMLAAFSFATSAAETGTSAWSGTEKTADKRPMTALDLLQIVDIGGYSGTIGVSPDGKWVVYQTQRANLDTNGYDIDWYIVQANGSAAPRRIDGGGEAMLASSGLGRINGARADIQAKWSPDSQRFAYLKLQAEEVQLWLGSPDGPPVQLSRNGADVEDFEWTTDGGRIIYKTGAPRAETERAIQEEAKSGYRFDDRFFLSYARKPLSVDCSDKPLMGAPRDERLCAGRTWTVSAATGADERASAEEEALYKTLKQGASDERLAGRDIKGLARGPNGRLAWFENEDPKTFAGFYPPRRVFVSSPEKRCEAPECLGTSMENLWWSDEGKEVILHRREGVKNSRSAFYRWQPDTGRVRRVLATEDKIFDCAKAGERLICLREGWTAPRKIISLDPASGAIKTLVDPNPQFGSLLQSKVEKLELNDGFGNDVVAHVVYPLNYQKGRRYPAVIVQYRSRGYLRGGTGDEYPIPIFAANGFVTISFDRPTDMRIMSRIGDAGEAEKLSWKDFYDKRSALNGLNSILDELETRGIVDPRKVALTGLSDGAETVQYSLIHSERFAAAAAASTYWSPAIYSSAPLFWRKQVEAQLGSPYESYEKWRGISLALNANGIDTPLLIQVSDQEVSGSIEDYTALKAAGKPVEMFVFPDGYHIKWLPSHKYAVYRRSLQWMKFWLEGEEMSDPVEPGQYARWREMREKQCDRLKGDDGPWYCR